MLTSRSVLRALALASAIVVSGQASGQGAATRQASAKPTQLPPATYKPEFGTMWTFDAPPLDYWRRTYGFAPDQRWLDHVRLSSVRLPNCSASFVSSRGLVMTNHHCGRDCTAAASPADSNYIQTGFAARTLADEKKCAGLYVDQLQSIQNVTDRVRGAITGQTPAAQAAQRTAVISQIQTECNQQTQLSCQVVSLYQGGIYSLYRYRRFSDLRLVMAPEGDIAFFGGDPDNFTYPRYDLDLTLLRVYENGQPYSPPDYLKWSPAGAIENELVFVVGNPGSTGRLNTISQMEYLRDIGYPATLAAYKRALAIYAQLAQTDTSAARRYQNDVFGVANSQKAVTGYRGGLLDTLSMSKKRAFEREFRARIAADPKLQAQYGGTWDAIAQAQRELATFNPQLRYRGFGGGKRLDGSVDRLGARDRSAQSSCHHQSQCIERHHRHKHREDRPGVVRRLRHSAASRCDVHSEDQRWCGEVVPEQRYHCALQDHVLRSLRAVGGVRRQGSVQASAALGGSEEQSRFIDSVQLRFHQRHHRRKFG